MQMKLVKTIHDNSDDQESPLQLEHQSSSNQSIWNNRQFILEHRNGKFLRKKKGKKEKEKRWLPSHEVH